MRVSAVSRVGCVTPVQVRGWLIAGEFIANSERYLTNANLTNQFDEIVPSRLFSPLAARRSPLTTHHFRPFARLGRTGFVSGQSQRWARSRSLAWVWAHTQLDLNMYASSEGKTFGSMTSKRGGQKRRVEGICGCRKRCVALGCGRQDHACVLPMGGEGGAFFVPPAEVSATPPQGGCGAGKGRHE